MGKILVIKGADFSNVAVDSTVINNEVDISDQVTYYNSYAGGSYTLINEHGWLMKSTGNSTVATKMIGCAGAKKIRISMPQFTSIPSQSLAFYSDNTEYNTSNISESQQDCPNLLLAYPRLKGDTTESVLMTYDIPAGAKYFRNTYFIKSLREEYGEMECVLIF